MNIAEQTKLPPVLTGFVINPDLPVIPYFRLLKDACCAGPHAHPRGQVIYASRGVMRVVAGNFVWFVPPAQAVWVPPMIAHQVSFLGNVAISNLFVDPSAVTGLPAECCVWNVSSLLRELIRKAMLISESYPVQGPESRLITVILDELQMAEPAPLCLPLAKDERLTKVTNLLMADPGKEWNQAQLAQIACTSPRTFARLFVKETGMSFGAWRRQLRLLEAIDRLHQGHSVTRVALELGYQSISAFVEMFRKTMGKSPMQFMGSYQ